MISLRHSPRKAGFSALPFVDGHSIEPLLLPNPPTASSWRTAFLVEGYGNKGESMPAYKAVRTTDHLWVEYANGEHELYDLSEDPYELRSLHETTLGQLKRALSSKLDELRDCAREGCRNAEGF